MGSIVLLDLVGGIALLLWGLHMVQSGILRAFGADLRRFLGVALRNRFAALAAGIGVTALLQSSTATGLMVTTFVGDGLVGLVPALAIMLGANIGTTLIVQLLSFDVSWLAPVLLAVGVVAFKRSARTLFRDLGRVAIGLGLMLLSLHILLDTLAPAENAPNVRVLLAAATAMPALNLVFGAALAWAAHSSVAVVLLVSSLAYSNFIGAEPAIALVLGANLGSAINPLLEGSFGNPVARRLPLGNLINRLVGCAIALPLLHPVAEAMRALDANPVRLIADFHTFFNVALAALFIAPLPAIASFLRWLLPQPAVSADPAAPLYLDPAAIATPSLALTCAARETLHMGDLIEQMLRKTNDALMTDDRRLVAEIERTDNAVDKLHEAIKLYVTRITRESLDEAESRRAMEIISFAINLEHIGDIIDKNLMELATKKIKNRLSFSEEGAAELEQFHGRVVDNLKLAFSVFMSGDVRIARRLVEEKVAIREAERSAAENHFARLREGRTESVETSSLHLDILRDLKRIFSHICAVGYPVLEAGGELQPSRLRATEPAARPAAGGLAGEQMP
jgi:phosphate:Na+ symporter